MKKIILIMFLLSAMLLSGCTIVNGESIVTGKVEPPTLEDNVKIYTSPPLQYEDIALVFASAGHDFKSNESLLKAAMDRLKEEAAKLGANGIILSKISQRGSPTVSYGVTTTNVAFSGDSTAAFGSSMMVSRGDTFTKIEGIAIHVQK